MDGQMTLPGIDILEWQYDEDNAMVMCRCPECGGRLIIHYYTYENPYHFCPYCGVRLQENERGIVSKRSEVYGRTKEEELHGPHHAGNDRGAEREEEDAQRCGLVQGHHHAPADQERV